MNFRSSVKLLFSNKGKIMNTLVAHDKENKITRKIQEF